MENTDGREVVTMQHREYQLPQYTEAAIGYNAERGSGRWVGMYRARHGRVVWNDGTLQHPLPGGLTEILEALWGELGWGYGYLLDLETRIVTILALKALIPFLQDIAGVGTPAPAAGDPDWWHDARDAQDVARHLLDYAEGLLAGTVAAPCGACYYGYVWDALLRAFAPCPWCSPLES